MADTELQQLAKTDRNPVQETRYQELLKQGGGGSEPSISLNDIGGSALDFAKTAGAGVNDAWSQYAMAARAQQNPLDIYTSLENAAGLPAMRATASTLRGQVGSLEDLIGNIEPNVSATTRNSLVTEAQRQGMVSAQQAPWIDRLNKIATSLGRVEQGVTSATQDIGTKTGFAVQGQQMSLDPLKMQVQLASDQAARLMTGFTSDREANLSILMDKLQRQRQLDDREWQQASDLAKMEVTYSQQKETLANTTQIIEVGGHKKLVNSQTGAVIADLGATAAPAAAPGAPTNLTNYYGGSYYPPQMSAAAGTIQNGYYSTGSGWVKVVQ